MVNNQNQTNMDSRTGPGVQQAHQVTDRHNAMSLHPQTVDSSAPHPYGLNYLPNQHQQPLMYHQNHQVDLSQAQNPQEYQFRAHNQTQIQIEDPHRYSQNPYRPTTVPLLDNHPQPEPQANYRPNQSYKLPESSMSPPPTYDDAIHKL